MRFPGYVILKVFYMHTWLCRNHTILLLQTGHSQWKSHEQWCSRSINGSDPPVLPASFLHKNEPGHEAIRDDRVPCIVLIVRVPRRCTGYEFGVGFVLVVNFSKGSSSLHHIWLCGGMDSEWKSMPPSCTCTYPCIIFRRSMIVL